MLYIWMPEGDGAWRWRVTGDWQVAANLDGLLQATKHENHKEAIVFFPTSSAQMLHQPMSRQQLRQIGANGVRYLLEEFSLTPVDQLRVQYHLDAQQQLNVLAIPAETITHYQHIMALGGWRVVAMLPDFLLLPAPETAIDAEQQQVHVMVTHNGCVMRTSELMAYAGDDLATLLSYFPQAKNIHVWGELSAHEQQSLMALTHLNIQVSPHLPTQASISDAQLIRHVFNVMPKSSDFQLSGYWRAIAAVLVVALLVQMLYDGVRWARYNHVANQTVEQSLQQYKAWFPDDRHVNENNLKRSIQAALGSNQNTDMTALSLLSRVGPLLQQAKLQTTQVHYHDKMLELQVTASGMPALEALRTQLNDQGLKPQLGAVSPVNGQVSGLIKVQ